MKSWKHWPYWLKGGVIGGGFIVLARLLAFGCDSCVFLSYPLILTSWLITMIGGDLGFFLVSYFPFSPLIIIAADIILWFLTGALFGFLIGSLKLNKKDSPLASP